MKNVEILNVALLSKWKWRTSLQKEVVWSCILKHRYGNPDLKVLVGDINDVTNKYSIWWRDLLTSDNYANLEENHFVGVVSYIVGDGNNVLFWYSCWAGAQTLREYYRELFSMTSDHLLLVAAASNVAASGQDWNLAVLFPADVDASNFLVQ